ncbi:uncharacterized protein RCC_04295 [Ramularia collo-cygni]|uniref:Tat pathway signal sequence n=1 Tax=Ramularia collo-cygni TaxID=112498 RepID=A0A2D3UZ13_9PEZI|nr:uncharacterized protein RCC_04295 [Ramularia collo-cygni]CZT18450.1 uncharacterized protein RCC_04295 [Ramularia collo-cygni]
MLLLSLIGIVAIDLSHKPSNLECAKQLSMYSPAMEAVEYIDIDFAASFNKHGVEIPVEEIQGLNRSESDHLRHVPPEIGTNYVGILEVFHQLHCLNMIRMYTWYQVDKFSGIPDGLSMSPLKNRMHIDHCIESLRISLMCAGDVTPLLIREGGPVGSKADFNTHHRCRNFEKLNDWIDNNWSVL